MRALLIVAMMASLTAGAQVTDKQLEQPPGQNWLHYNGDYSSKRFSTLDQITTANVGSLVNRWTFHVPGPGGLESVPVVVNGVMYLTQPNTIYAIDGKTGRLIWTYHHPLAKVKDREGPHRGAAVYKNRVYFTTTDDYLYALDAASGNVIWVVKIAETEEGYASPAAPLIAKGKVIVGVSPGDRGLNGFLDAYDADTGKRLWRYEPIPRPGQPGSDTWAGNSWEHGGADTWLTGSYDPELNLLYWGIGNPSPDFNGDMRKGDNLYTECMVALDLDTGKMKWYFQFTPHDTMDWDAVEIPILVDAQFNGKPRKLLVQADRNGFYYVLDRVTGEFLHGSQFDRSQNWANGLDAKGRPIRRPGSNPTLTGVKICPSSIGATNWMSPTYDPQTGWFYFVALEGCGFATMSTQPFQPGGYEYRNSGDVLQKDGTWKVSVRALELTTGKQMWETPRVGSTSLGGGLVSTKGGVIFSGEGPGQFVALDPKTGRVLWHYYTGQKINAQPMTYMADGKQYVAIEANSDVFGFALFEPEKPSK